LDNVPHTYISDNSVKNVSPNALVSYNSYVEVFRELGLLNKNGVPRLDLAHFYFRRGIDLDLLIQLYRYWRDFDERIVIKKSWWEGYEIKSVFKAVKCAKRGNDVYLYRMRKRLDWMEKVENVEFFSDAEACLRGAKSRLLFITLTYDTNRCSRYEAWLNIGKEYNRWISRVRRRYGRVSVFRVWQSMVNGYPHVHAILLFHEYEFTVFKYQSKEGLVTYRVTNKEDLAKSWHSFVDVCAVKSSRGAFKYAKRYLTKRRRERDANDPNQKRLIDYAKPMYIRGSHVTDLDYALMWLFKKRSFSLSGDFRKAYHDLIVHMRNSNFSRWAQVDLDGNEVNSEVWYEFIGVFPAKMLNIRVENWVVYLDKAVYDRFKRVRDAKGEHWELVVPDEAEGFGSFGLF